jgi:ribosomal protein S18 acetylase RimI-like enzyme
LTREDELALMQELAAEAWRLRGPHVEHHAGDLAWSTYFAPGLRHRRRLWRERERCVAWAWLEEPSSLMFLVHPDRTGLLGEVLEWADASETSALEDDAESIRALEDGGYVRCSLDEPFFAHLLHSLGDIGEPRLPPGFSLRHAREEDLERRVAVHRAAWSPSRVTEESWRRVMSAYPYKPELDCVVEAPDGTFAASCLVWLDDRTGVGLIEPVGTDPRFSRRGLARAVCLHGLRELRRHGGKAALVHARGDAAYTAPKRLYESIGFREYARSPRFRRAA